MSIIITNPYDYKPLNRVSENGTRFYVDPSNNKLPSVTTILDKTKDKTFLNEWKKRVGETEAKRISTEAAGLGTLVHTHLEKYILGEDRPSGNNVVHQMAKAMSDVVIEKGLSQVTEVWGSEVGLYYPDLYAGTTDLVGCYQGEPAIIDFKNTTKPKKEEWIEDYYLQTVAYALAHNAVHGTNIKRGVIFMIARDNTYQQFDLQGAKFEVMCEKWGDRVAQYYKLN
jgi:ATP-dependent exoDNAse (exonuclease V) beta subunit